MRGKRSKQYRKLMEQFSMAFGFREPYQVLVDAEMVKDSCRFKMDLNPALERTVHGKVKGMITQCEIRKLYAQKNEPGGNEAIELAKTLERRRCGHHPDQYPEPLSTQECIMSVIDPKDSGQNKHRYVVASQDVEVRRKLRTVRGVPLIYIKRSVMILEPMADESAQARLREEKIKFRAEIKNALGKRKRNEEDDDDKSDGDSNSKPKDQALSARAAEEKKKAKGRKGPNPLSVKKAKKKPEATPKPKDKPESTAAANSEADGPAKRKRRRRAKAAGDKAEPDEGVAKVQATEIESS
uniref:U three protein 23 n=1 Tax=Bionectria ochroleuca TaxID=29856 RepID=A0A8H7N9L7_BIOOC